MEAPEEDFEESSIVKVRRMRSARTSKTPFEVLVVFDEKYSSGEMCKELRGICRSTKTDNQLRE